ncbi:SOS response-associated peptidase [Alkalicaulis satelles]|uniref:Abasic site processing protein n=1 Tax=Alkalicaulis satelles TaxID=2609175 RepID=A0A5M6ZKY7_9PROT|nr:SOS response-associated peptidase [Alkalicaulis satelles]KAA5804970.1 SOS response-associated peptidase [Alkalicaulis satelles]
MCGRYVITLTVDQLRALFECQDRPNLQPSWNAAPTQDLPVVRRGAGGRARLTCIRWGLVPHWSRTGPAGARPLINARSETAADKPTFRAALKRRRALIPADGFYEWRSLPGGKQPWYITRTDGAPLVFAGLWERWGEGADRIDSFAILTRQAGPDTAWLHDRVPVMLAPDAFQTWLDPDTDPEPFFAPLDEGALSARPVSRRVNAVRANDAGLIEAGGEGDE